MQGFYHFSIALPSSQLFDILLNISDQSTGAFDLFPKKVSVFTIQHISGDVYEQDS